MLNIEDEEILKKLEQIDIYSLKYEKTKEFGISLNYYNKAQDVLLRLKSNLFESGLITTVVCLMYFASFMVSQNIEQHFKLAAIFVLILKTSFDLIRKMLAHGAFEKQSITLHKDLDALIASDGNPNLMTSGREPHHPEPVIDIAALIKEHNLTVDSIVTKDVKRDALLVLDTYLSPAFKRTMKNEKTKKLQILLKDLNYSKVFLVNLFQGLVDYYGMEYVKSSIEVRSYRQDTVDIVNEILK